MVRLCVLALLLLVEAAVALPIAPDWGAGGPPSFAPGSTMWMEGNVRACPTVYRTELAIAAGTASVVGRLRSRGWAYVWVDGQLSAEFADQPATRERAASLVSWPVTLDLTTALTPGRHVLAISGADEGVDLRLAVSEPGGSRTLTTDTTWRANRFAPLTQLGREPWQQPGANLAGWVPVRALADPPLTLADAEAVERDAAASRAAAARDEAAWRLAMLADRGWAINHWRTVGFGGPGRLDAGLLAAAREAKDQPPAAQALCSLAWLLDEQVFWRQTAGLANEAAAAKAASTADRAVAEARAALVARDWLTLASQTAAALDVLDQQRELLRRAHRWPVNRLNEGYGNRAGWLDLPELVGSRLADWGLRVNPPTATWQIDLAGKWRFRLDPDNQGLADTVHTPGYNIDNQWREITVPGAWEQQGYQGANPRHPADNPFIQSARADGPYNGYAWYRRTVQVPAEWAGHDLELDLGVIDDFDWTYVNGELVGQTGRDTAQWWLKERVYRVPAERVRFGQANLIAVRVYDEADKGGILSGQPQLRCPGLKAAYDSRLTAAHRPVEVFESPLSPVAELTLGESELHLSGWTERALRGPDRLLTPAGLSDFAYDPARRNANWLCLWPNAADRAGGDLPLLIVCEAKPQSVRHAAGEVVIGFDQPGRRVRLARPLRGQVGDTPTAADVAALTLWSRAALALPTDYAELSRRTADGIEVTDRYSYRELRDAWGTKPLRLALLPPLGSYALACHWPGYSVEATVQDLGVDLGVYGTLRGVSGSDTIRYRLPLDRLPRLAGLTDFCFGPTDVGGPGNRAEIGLMQDIGCNSWRPQSNDLGDRMRRTVTLANQHGLNLMVNVDNRFGAEEQVFDAYRQLAEWAMAQPLPAGALAYDLINEPANMKPEVYNPRIARLVQTIRAVDKVHPIYIETPNSYAAIEEFAHLAPVDDPLVVYSFHDYVYRLTPRWPYAERDRRSLLRQWLPAMRYSLAHNAPIHLGEFGGFHQTPHDPWHNQSTLTLLDDVFGIMDAMGWHFHYYSNRGEWVTRADGSLDGNLVHAAFERYFARHTLNP